MNKLINWFNLYRKGEMVDNPVAWKNGQISVTLVTAFIGAIIALAKNYGYQIPLDEITQTHIAYTVIALVGLFNVNATLVSSEKVGLPPKPDIDSAGKALTG